MAITSGAGPHFAFVIVGGQRFPIEHGTVSQHKTRKSSGFGATIPMSYPGAEATFAELGDNTTTIEATTRDITNTLFTGETDTADFDYISRTIHITGRDKAAKLHSNKSSEKWQNKKGSEIVSDLAGRVGLSAQVDASMLNAGKMLEQDWVRISDNVSFAYVIHKLAEFDGARWWVDPMGTLHYQSQNNPEGTYSLNYVPPDNGPMSADFMRLRIQRNIQAGKTVKVKVKSWHPKDKKMYESEKTVGGNGGPLEYNYHIPNLKQSHVDRHAESKANEHARHELRLHVDVVGDPTVNVAMSLVLNGTGFFDQEYEMDTVHHTLGMSGHRTSITARAGKGGRSAS
jgi:hypothetical protein